jgi:hypothetical protein
VQHQKCLILTRFDRDKAHIGTGHRFANGGSISGVVLRSPPHEGFDITWRHEAHVMAELLQLTGPVVGSRTRLNTNQTRGQRLEEGQKLTTRKPLTVERSAGRIGDMDVKHVLSQIKAHGGWVHGYAPSAK